MLVCSRCQPVTAPRYRWFPIGPVLISKVHRRVRAVTYRPANPALLANYIGSSSSEITDRRIQVTAGLIFGAEELCLPFIPRLLRDEFLSGDTFSVYARFRISRTLDGARFGHNCFAGANHRCSSDP